MTTTSVVAPGAQGSPNAGSANEGNLSSWVGPYVTGMLGQGQALANMPYQTYQGPLTAGPSSLQQNLFQGLGSINLPQNYGQSWTNTGAPTMPSTATPAETSLVSQAGQGNTSGFGQPMQLDTTSGGNSIAAQYMNPYLAQSLQPQLNQLAYTAGINEQGDLSKLTQAGAFGGSRQAVQQGIDQGNLLASQANLIGQGYNTAYNQAQNQFNTEQGQANTLANTLAGIGGQQQAINQAGVTADYNQFLQQQQYPEQQVQFEQSLLSGLPISTVSNIPVQLTPAQQLIGSTTATTQLLQNLGLLSPTTTTSASSTSSGTPN
jgi:hypothetical protein